MKPDIILTIDTDWCPSWMIEVLADKLEKKGVKATWFITNHCAGLDRLRKRNDFFELGIHPNFLTGSTHGKSEYDVMKHMKEIVPEAVSMRSHSLYQHSRLLHMAYDNFDIKFESNILMHSISSIEPVYFRVNNHNGIWRFPVFFEDDYHAMEFGANWDIGQLALNSSGLKVLMFHPALILLNANSDIIIPRMMSVKPLEKWDERFIRKWYCSGEGAGTLFESLVHSALSFKWMREIVS